MGKKQSKLVTSLSFDHERSLQWFIGIRKKNIPPGFYYKFDEFEEIKPVYTTGKYAVRLVENLILVWLDISSEKHTEANQKTLNQLRRVVNIVRTFADLEKCFHFISSVRKEKILFVVSGSFGAQIVPRIENFEQIRSIYIFCGNRDHHKEWIKAYQKIRSIHTQIKDLCDALRSDSNHYDKSLTAISILPPSPVLTLGPSNKQFIYLQVMKSILLQIEYDEKFRRELTDYARTFYGNNPHQMASIESFDANYAEHTPIWWFSKKDFTYRMLRKAFLMQDFEIIYKLAFYIRDLHREIKKAYLQIHSHQYHLISLYRATQMTNAEFEHLEANRDGLLSFNDFVLATLERIIAVKFAQKILSDPNVIAVIFKLDVDPSKSSIPFVAFNNLTYLNGTNGEILLSMNTIFHIDAVEKITDRLYEVTLCPASKKDEQIVNIINYMQEITCGLSGWYKLSKIMMEVQEYDQVEHIYKYIYDQTQEDQRAEQAYLLHELGYVYDLKHELAPSITHYRRAIETSLTYIPAHHSALLPTYVNLAGTLQKQGNMAEALVQYQLAVKVQKPSDPMVIAQYNNIAGILQQQGKHSEAQQAYIKAITGLIQDFPSEHQILANTYHNLAGLYFSMKDYTQALTYYQHVLDLDNKFLPQDSPLFISLYFNLAETYRGLKDGRSALQYAEKSLEAARLAHGDDHWEVKENRMYLDQLRSKTS